MSKQKRTKKSNLDFAKVQEQFQQLQNELDVSFRNERLLMTAFTH